MIAAEIQCFGANTFATLFRGGKGVPYREVLTDVCDKSNVSYKSDASVESIEMSLFLKIATDAAEKMTKEELQQLVETLNLKTTDLSKQAVVAALQSSVHLGGFAAYKVTLMVANAVAKATMGKGLSFIANKTLTKVLFVGAGPIGWIVTGLWTALGIASPAFRITIPAVIQVAHLRAYKKQKIETST